MSATPRVDALKSVTMTRRDSDDFARELERENIVLRSVIRAAYLRELGKLPDFEAQKQLGRDLATYGQKPT